ncbi:MAG TPA: glycosyltransferase family 4 protein [Solirubrobacteraceae bacterium]|nr:glycosyltransferase family 4 protein [Solirubrobacteraceae bacterium]
MRVLMFSWEYPPVVEGGLGRHVRGLAEQLVVQGVELHIVSRGPEAIQYEERQGVIVHRIAQPPFPRDADAFLRWVADMNREMSALADGLATELEIDLVHSHDWLVSDAARACARDIERPWVVTVHATEHGRHQGWVNTHPQSAIHRAERAMARGADRIITCSRYMRGHVAEVFGVPRRRITALRNGIDPTAATPPVDVARARAGLAAPDELLVLLVGRLVYEKGFHVALDALAPLVHGSAPLVHGSAPLVDGSAPLVQAGAPSAGTPPLSRARAAGARPRVRFAVVGTGTAEQELRLQARRLGLERAGAFLGWVGDERLRELYRAADVCVVPSLYEPFGIVALEAMAGGCPCVVADTGGLREIVPAGERVGVRVPPDDAGALRDALSRLLGDTRLRARLAAEALEHVGTFDWPRVAEATREVYARVCAQVPARA